ncbi:MAG: SDR family oxidoreductase [Vicinamibacterales bacterium]|jgi:nucleoside-diphosphate-sugar epimerase|nr:SDR family oxidoreductase [Vicinamibacterales bacterium]
MAHYLVTGGAGFIGSHLVEELVRRGERVRVVDSLVTGYRRNLAAVASRVEFIEGDLAQAAVAAAASAGVDYILHQAAIPSVPRSVTEPVFCHEANVNATLNLLVAARDAGVRRLVFAGSSSVYGNVAVLPTHEDVPLDPLTPYALQKLIGEQYLRLFTSLYGLETVTTRYFNVFGPRQDPSSAYSGVISLFIRSLLDGRTPTIFGDGEQTRDFTYVANVVDGVLKACHAPGVAGGVINVATGGRVSLNTLFGTLRSLTGADVVATYGPARRGDIRDSQANIGRARALLGYSPTVELPEGLARTLAWARQAGS